MSSQLEQAFTPDEVAYASYAAAGLWLLSLGLLATLMV
jgi:hypothetical protein